MSNDKQFIGFKKEVEKLKEIDGAEEYAKQLAHLFLGNGLSLKTILLMAIDFGQQHPNWIPVEERLPKEQDWYLCYNDVEDGSEVLHWEGDGNVWMDNDWHYKSKEITHWMTLPQPPRKEE